MLPTTKLLSAGLLAAVPAAALAHHGWSSYDETKPLTLTGPLSDLEWANPHATAKVNWRDRKWDVILAPVSRMTARGLVKGEIDKAQRVTITGYARRGGTAEIRLERIKVGDKTVELR
jgi:hypothetical protein